MYPVPHDRTPWPDPQTDDVPLRHVPRRFVWLHGRLQRVVLRGRQPVVALQWHQFPGAGRSPLPGASRRHRRRPRRHRRQHPRLAQRARTDHQRRQRRLARGRRVRGDRGAMIKRHGWWRNRRRRTFWICGLNSGWSGRSCRGTANYRLMTQWDKRRWGWRWMFVRRHHYVFTVCVPAVMCRGGLRTEDGVWGQEDDVRGRNDGVIVPKNDVRTRAAPIMCKAWSVWTFHRPMGVRFARDREALQPKSSSSSRLRVIHRGAGDEVRGGQTHVTRGLTWPGALTKRDGRFHGARWTPLRQVEDVSVGPCCRRRWRLCVHCRPRWNGASASERRGLWLSLGPTVVSYVCRQQSEPVLSSGDCCLPSLGGETVILGSFRGGETGATRGRGHRTTLDVLCLCQAASSVSDDVVYDVTTDAASGQTLIIRRQAVCAEWLWSDDWDSGRDSRTWNGVGCRHETT